MRDAVSRLGGDPEKINPVCPADLVIDHSIQVDVSRRYFIDIRPKCTLWDLGKISRGICTK